MTWTLQIGAAREIGARKLRNGTVEAKQRNVAKVNFIRT